MRLYRFYVGDSVELTHTFWLHDERILHQWVKVLRYRPEDQVILFDGVKEDRQYKILQLDEKSAHLELVTELVRKAPKKELYLFWSMLKKEKNDWVLQKSTEIGVSHFVPILSERTEKTGFDEERARKIVIEAAEQSGRSDIPFVSAPVPLKDAVDRFAGSITLCVAEQGNENATFDSDKSVGIFIGPEGGWTDAEKEFFESKNLKHVGLGDFTLRAETACVAGATKLLS